MDHKSSDLQKTHLLLSKATAYLELHQNKGPKKDKFNASTSQAQHNTDPSLNKSQDTETISQEELIHQLQENLEELINYALNPDQFFLESTGINKEDISRESWGECVQSLIDMLISLGQHINKNQANDKKKAHPTKKKPLPVDDEEDVSDYSEELISELTKEIKAFKKKTMKKKIEENEDEDDFESDEEEKIPKKKAIGKKIKKNVDESSSGSDYDSEEEEYPKKKAIGKKPKKDYDSEDSMTESDYDSDEEEEEIPKPKISKNKLPVIENTTTPFQQNTFSENILKNLVLLLSPNSKVREGFLLNESSKAWRSILKALLSIDLLSVVQTGALNTLMLSFIEANTEIQKTSLSQILQLSQNLTKSSDFQKEASKRFLSISMDYLQDRKKKTVEQLQLIKNWLEILIFDKVTNSTKYHLQLLTKSSYQLEDHYAFDLFTKVSRYLITDINFGLKEGYQNMSTNDLFLLEIGNLLLQLIFKADSLGESILSNLNNEQILTQLIRWYLLNTTSESFEDYSGFLCKEISTILSNIFDKIAKHEEISKLSLEILIREYKQLDTNLRNSNLSHYIIFNYAQRSTQVLEELLGIWMQNDKSALYVAKELRTFEYFLEKIGQDDQSKSNKLKGNSLLKEIARVQKSLTSEDQAGKPSDIGVKTHEVATKISLVSQTTPETLLTDWAAHKNGSKSSAYSFTLNESECSLLFKFDREYEINHIKVGFNMTPPLFIPKNIAVDGGSSESDLTYLGVFDLTKDKKLNEEFSVQTFEKNFKMIQSPTETIKESLESLLSGSQKVRFLKFRFNVTEKNPKISISFISVLGILNSDLEEYKKKVQDMQEQSTLKFISMFCNLSYTQTLEYIAQDKTVFSKLQNCFDSFAVLLIPHELWLAPFLIGLSAHNQNLGEWVMNKLLDLNMSKEHAKTAAEIILANSKFTDSRLSQLHTFIITQLTKLQSLPSKSDALSKFIRLVPFIDSFCAVVYSLSPETTNLAQFTITQQDLEMVITSFNHYIASTYNKTLIKLIIVYLNMSAFSDLKDKSAFKPCLEKLWGLIYSNKKLAYLEMLGPIIIGSNFAAKWFSDFVNPLCEDIITRLQDLNAVNIRLLRHSLTFLNDIAFNDTIKKKLFSEQWHFKIYKSLKNENLHLKTILREIDSEILKLLVELIKNIVLGYPNAEQDLAKEFIQDIGSLESKRDPNFINNLLVPLLNAETEIPVCFYPFDTLTNKPVLDLRRLSRPPKRAQKANTNNAFKSSLLNEAQSDILMNTINRQTKLHGSSHKFKNASWALVARTTFSGENVLPSIKEKMANQGPFLVILKGTDPDFPDKQYFIGAFSSQSFPEMNDNYQPTEEEYERLYTVPSAKDSFLFYYNGEKTLHYPPPNTDTSESKFAELNIQYEGEDNFSFFHGPNQQISIYFSSDEDLASYVEPLTNQMKNLENEKSKNFPVELLEFNSVEYWVLQSQEENLPALNLLKNPSSLLNTPFLSEKCHPQRAINYHRANSIYSLPASFTFEQLATIGLNSKISFTMRLTKENLAANTSLFEVYEFIRNQSHGILDLQFEAHELIEKQITKKLATSENFKYKPVLSFFESFEKQGGVTKIIQVGLQALKNWKDQTAAAKWKAWLEEITSFGALPHFFALFLKNHECIDYLFKILTGEFDKSSGIKEEHQAVHFTYQILSELFNVDDGAKLRDLAVEKNFFSILLDRLGHSSKEVKRKWCDTLEPKEHSETESSPNKSVTAAGDDDYTKKIVKKKGVGYGSDATGDNKNWNVNDYFANKKTQNEHLQSMIDIVANFIHSKYWQPPKNIINQLCESALLPLLESAFRSGSLLDMTKEASLHHSYLKLTRALASNNNLIPCLLELDKHYIPQQKDSVWKLLTNLKGLAQIFLSCLQSTNQQQQQQNEDSNKKLAEDILNTYESVKEALKSEKLESNNQDEMDDILSQPLPVAYRTLLQNLRFDYVNMKGEDGEFKHHYPISNTTPSQQKLVRLAQELADMSNALPIEHTNSIFVRVDETRVDVMKALITGAAGTPYGHGAFEFDIYFDDSYPNNPPKVNLTTTGGGTVRFNPNLYECGKVCLSLLGTWRGNASENWDPKLSTLLQVLVSIQAIIMSEEVFFNEPGYEHESGTEVGESKNEAYSNVVRYANIKFAMIEQIRHPPKGFETIIKRHFYLKKDEILEEVRKWVKYAQHRTASYTCLVADHNPDWCSQFQSSPTRYQEMLEEAIQELETELNKLEPPTLKASPQKVAKKKERKAKTGETIDTGLANIDDVDVGYENDQVVTYKEMNIQDDNVKDRWSRYIGAMGLDAVTKQAGASIFLSGLGALGLEITKNIVLSGVKRFTIHDNSKTTYRDLSGQFFLSEDDIGKNRAQASLNKIQQLNYYVKVDTAHLNQTLPTAEQDLEKLLKGYTVVILTETDYQTQIAINQYCRKNNIHFIVTDLQGPFAKLFTDFGDEFIVVDKNGEELQEVMISSITNEEKALVTLLPGHTHKFEDGDKVVFYGVEGMTEINQTEHIVQIVNASSFRIGDTRGYTEYIRNGLVKPLRVPVPTSFKSLQDSLINPPFDTNMMVHDFIKLNHPQILHIAFQALDEFFKRNRGLPKPWNIQDSEEFTQIALEMSTVLLPDCKPLEDQKFKTLIQQFSFTCQGVFSPLAAFMGGYVAQEAIKAVTQKFMPTKQFFYSDCAEVIPQYTQDLNELGVLEKGHRSDGLRICVGQNLLQEIQHANLFMVGAGAIGCELLKNYAMIGLGTGTGKIVLTDPDVIEVSNLNRQFLFREKHLRKPKSQTAAAAALQMNKDLKGHIFARLDKVHEGTSNIYTDKFFEDLTVVTNALDNVQARRYIDLRCVNAKTPLLESGTLGPKGHVQVIIPYKTESYNSQEDPKDEAEIPHCTLKMFPEETLHCVEWARDKFGKLFTQRPKALLKLLEEPHVQITGSQEVKTLREAITLLEKKPTTFDDCIRYARIKFQKYFVNDIKQLLYTYPLDLKTKEGKPFWTLPKRPPTEIAFDPTNDLHSRFVTACACLRANIFNIPIPADARKESGRQKIAQEAAQVRVPEFKPSDAKSKAINSEVKKEDAVASKKDIEEEEEPIKENEAQELSKKWQKYQQEIKPNNASSFCKPEDFEKDNDQNYHIDFIHAIANCRASNYSLEVMDWMTVKLKAGRIVPALATTTASIAGLQTIELCKLLKKCQVQDMKNAFLSLAVPILALSEPGSAPTTKLAENLTVNLWDRWDVTLPKEATLKDLFKHLEDTYSFFDAKDVNYGSQNIYFSALMNIPGKEKQRETKLNSKLKDLLGLEEEETYADLSIMFSKKGDSEILKGVPLVRVVLNE